MSILQTIFTALLLFLSLVCSSQSKKPGGVKCIVIDAGHGGKDPGATVGKLQEKTITLAVALELGRQVSSKYPSVKVVYTRRDDRFVELASRSDIANKAEADLFVSIHTNASKNSSASGTETFVMGVDKGNANLGVAMRENDVISLESDYSERYEGYDPGSSESFIIFSLMQYAYQRESLRLASLVQQRYDSNTSMKNRGVKQAGFLVLWRTAMPSILTEIGFLSNPEEARFMASAAGQRTIAQSLLSAIDGYMGTATEAQTEKIKPDKPENTTPSKTTPAIAVSKNSENSTKSGEITFRIQIKSSLKQIPITSRNFGSYYTSVEEKRLNNLYKYFCGKANSYKEALLLQQKIRKTFPDAFCVAFSSGKVITMEQAKKLKP